MFLFCFVFFVRVFFFSAKTTVQWYFIVGPLLAVTVLAFIVLCLWKRRIAGTYTVNFSSLRGPYQHNKIRWTELKMNCGCSMKTEKDKNIYEYWKQFDVIWKWVGVAQSSVPNEDVRFWILWLRFWSFPDEKNEKMKRSLIYNGAEQFVYYWVMPYNYKYFVIGLNTSKTDQDDVCKLGSVCCTLSSVPWSQLRSEMKEHFIGWCCQPSKYSSFQFFFFPSLLSQKNKQFVTNYYESKYL